MRPLAVLPVLLLVACDDYVLKVGDGTSVFDQRCAVCHDPEGAEDQVGPALGPIVPTLTDAEIVDVVENGVGSMPPAGLDDAELDELIPWLRDHFGDNPAGN